MSHLTRRAAFRIKVPCLKWQRNLATEISLPDAPTIHPLLSKRAEALKSKFNHIEKQISSGSFEQDISREFSNLSIILENYNDYQQDIGDYNELKELVHQDPELGDEATKEISIVLTKLKKTVNSLQSRLLPQIIHKDRPAILELRPGIGGAEAAIFTNDLLNMYINFANHMNWKWKLLSKTMTSNGFINEAILSINNKGSYDVLRHESGVHRIQRIPSTEAKGRIHTSTAAVVVLPKMSEGDERSLKEDEKVFKSGEIRIDTMRAGGKGGQHVNTTDSAVRLTHIPTGLQVVQQDERSQPKNKAKAFSILRARLAAIERDKEIQEQRKLRTDQVTSTDRSDKIRTYNVPQNRVTDHRCGFSLYDINSCLNGSKLFDIIEEVSNSELKERLEILVESDEQA